MIYTCFHLTFFFLLRNYNFSFPFFKFSSFILLFIRVIFFMKMCVYITVLVVQLIPYLLHVFHVQAHGFYENTGLTDNGQNNKNWVSNYVELPKIQIDYSNYMIDIPSTACQWFLRNYSLYVLKYSNYFIIRFQSETSTWQQVKKVEISWYLKTLLMGCQIVKLAKIIYYKHLTSSSSKIN